MLSYYWYIKGNYRFQRNSQSLSPYIDNQSSVVAILWYSIKYTIISLKTVHPKIEIIIIKH